MCEEGREMCEEGRGCVKRVGDVKRVERCVKRVGGCEEGRDV